jgi:hypothetical protein
VTEFLLTLGKSGPAFQWLIEAESTKGFRTTEFYFSTSSKYFDQNCKQFPTIASLPTITMNITTQNQLIAMQVPHNLPRSHCQDIVNAEQQTNFMFCQVKHGNCKFVPQPNRIPWIMLMAFKLHTKLNNVHVLSSGGFFGQAQNRLEERSRDATFFCRTTSDIMAL